MASWFSVEVHNFAIGKSATLLLMKTLILYEVSLIRFSVKSRVLIVFLEGSVISKSYFLIFYLGYSFPGHLQRFGLCFWCFCFWFIFFYLCLFFVLCRTETTSSCQKNIFFFLILFVLEFFRSCSIMQRKTLDRKWIWKMCGS